MEASCVVSPSGKIYPSTPVNDAAVLTMQRLDALLSNKKNDDTPSKSKSLFNDPINVQVPKVPINVPIVHDTQVTDPQNEKQQQYEMMMRQIQRQLQALEQQLEMNEARHKEELIQVQATRDGDRDTANQRETQRTREFEMRERELSLRERELSLREREVPARTERDVPKKKIAELTHCCLSISDPAGDVVCDLAMCLPLEGSLRNDRWSISTVHSLLNNALTRHEPLRNILSLVDTGHSCRFVIQKFKNVFSSLYDTSPSTMSLISIMAKARVNVTKVKSAVKFSGSKTLVSLLEAVPAAEKNGVVPALNSEFKLMKLTDLPGIRELLDRTDQTEIEKHWLAIDTFTDAVVFFVGDRKKKLSDSKAALDNFDGAGYTDCTEMLAVYGALFDVCTSWFGSAVQNDFDKVQRFLIKCPGLVQIQYAKHISTPHDGIRIDELEMAWDEFENILHEVWISAFTERQLQLQFGLVGGLADSQRTRTPARRALPATVPKNDGLSNSGDKMEDITIVCRDCRNGFIFSVSQQEKHVKEGYDNQPARCAKCKGMECDIFKETGECPFGEDCKYLHVEGSQDDDADKAKRKHSYSCRFDRLGTCKSGANCMFAHDSDRNESTVGSVNMMHQFDSVVDQKEEIDLMNSLD